MAYLPDILAIGTGGTFTTTTEESPPTVSQIADAVWDELTSGHATTGTYGLFVSKILKFIYELMGK